jgi:hypothetical protein
MSDDAGTEQEPGSLSGEVEPSSPGEWITLEAAGARLGIDRKAVYRRIRRGSMIGKKAPNAAHLLVWMPEEPRSPSDSITPAEEPRSLAVPDQGERLMVMLETSVGRALAPLNDTIEKQRERIEELIRENERLRITGERRSRWEELRSWWRERFG